MLQNFANDARRACEYTRDRVSNGKLPYQNTPLGEGSVKNGMLPPLEVSCATLKLLWIMIYPIDVSSSKKSS